MRRTAIVTGFVVCCSNVASLFPKGRSHVNTALPGILEDADSKLSGALRVLLAQLKLELDQTTMRIDEADAVFNQDGS